MSRSSDAYFSVADAPRRTEQRASYTAAELVTALRAAGLGAGDTVFVHACLNTLGPVAGCALPEEGAMLVVRALWDVLGSGGTIVVPTYTFSFCRQQPFDLQ